MPSTYDRLVLGAGTTAAVYLSFFPPGKEEKVGVIGLPEPWSQRGDHRMGQPPHLLLLPQAREERPDEFPAYSELTEEPSTDRAPQNPFLTSDVYARQIQTRTNDRGIGKFKVTDDDARKYRMAWVDRVTRLSLDLFRVSYHYGDDRHKYLLAKQVIVATGPGAPNDPTCYDSDAPEGVYYTGDSYLSPSVQAKSRVAVEGGSATAAWCVEKALLEGAKSVLWFQRESGGQGIEERFAQAFPAGDRNLWLKSQSEKVVQLVSNITGARWDDADERLALTFRTYSGPKVDQYVAAVGAKETADFLGDLRNELEAVVDDQGYVHPSKDAILAYKLKTGALWIVGAGVFKVANNRPNAAPARYTRVNEYLPTAARPPEGIPTIIASIAALTRYLGRGKGRYGDINLANFGDLDRHFTKAIGESLAYVVAERLRTVDVRTVGRFLTDQVIGTRIMKSSPYGIRVEELATLYENVTRWDTESLRNLISAYAE